MGHFVRVVAIGAGALLGGALFLRGYAAGGALAAGIGVAASVAFDWFFSRAIGEDNQR